MARTFTETDFRKDVAKHAMIIVNDAGLHRHLSFRQPEHSWLHYFEIVTWPGALCIRGDVGTYVFSRTQDMFSFFRQPTKDGSLYINDDYWAEKLVASCCNGRHGEGVMRFDSDLFRDAVWERYVDHVRHYMRGMPDERRALRQALEDEVLGCAEDGEQEARRAADAFEHDGFRLTDFWEVNCSEYTRQFMWSLYAISWGIRQYDQHHPQRSSSAA